MKILIKGGRVIDPANNIDDALDILIKDSKIFRVGKNIKDTVDQVIDAKDKIIMPGLVDMHVHLREPGREDKETVASGTKAALKGGVTSVLAMPNTFPAMDSAQNIKDLSKIIADTASSNVFICGAITLGRAGKELTNAAELKQAGARAISDDGSSVDDGELFAQAVKKAHAEGVLVISHCEDKALSANGVVNLGFISTCLGLRGISKESEYKRVQRDIQIAQDLGARLHIAHVSTKESVELIRKAKKKQSLVTCETAPHYFCLTEEDTRGYDANKKMNPPLRSRQDLEAIKQGLEDGTIDAIASDHAPHTESEKDIEFDRAEFGVIGLETELSLAIIELVEPRLLGFSQLVEKLSWSPAKILGIDKGTLGEGKDADIIIVSPNSEWVAAKENLISRSKNSAFIGKKLKGVVEYTICSGNIVYQHQSS